jgi:hypothetical protein
MSFLTLYQRDVSLDLRAKINLIANKLLNETGRPADLKLLWCLGVSIFITGKVHINPRFSQAGLMQDSGNGLENSHCLFLWFGQQLPDNKDRLSLTHFFPIQTLFLE